ncbi:MAG TPA: penicillin acylase family protein, partial [Ferruginibacter sp.]|nr:penicillin acylase family protein [Ferruginibacter sp.]
AGSKTKSGAPILCNDPHLGLNLPSLWYEIQLSTPGYNAYGVSFPGAPGVIIGFNDSCAFGFTNGGRDVRDYYEIRFKDEKRTEYWFNGQWMPTTFRYEQIKVAGKPTVVDTVAYTVLGPVMYDASFTGNRATNQKNYAVHWSAHNPSNELMLFSILNRARNYADYLEATKYLETPGQNCVFACKNGDIALRTQGRFPAKWKGQGDFVMPGTDSSYLWQGYIPNAEVPYQYNPERGFVSSANQEPADTTYPYYLGSDYPTYRGFIINRLLNKMQQVTPVQMMRMQCSNYNVFAEMALPIFTKHMLTNQLTEEEQGYFSTLASWNKINDVNEKGATIFAETWKAFMDTVYYDEFAAAPPNTARPYESTLLEAVLKDSTYKFIDDIRTPGFDSLNSIVTIAFKKAVTRLREANQENRLPWGKYKDTHVNHLLRLPAFSRLHLPIGGGTHIINATKEGHGPIWRMVISLTKETEAYGVYPGGQNGNPGSKYYDQFVDHWVKGEYYSLWMMKASETSDKRIIGKLHFSKS